MRQGEGKSILLGSIAVALGLQNFKGFAREDADYALSELVFVIENEEQRQALLELEIPVEDGEVIISRRLSKGRTTSKINGEIVPVSMVRKAGTLLIDIHGQHENQSLLHIRKHLELLDDFGEKLTLAKESSRNLLSGIRRTEKGTAAGTAGQCHQSKRDGFFKL